MLEGITSNNEYPTDERQTVRSKNQNYVGSEKSAIALHKKNLTEPSIDVRTSFKKVLQFPKSNDNTHDIYIFLTPAQSSLIRLYPSGTPPRHSFE